MKIGLKPTETQASSPYASLLSKCNSQKDTDASYGDNVPFSLFVVLKNTVNNCFSFPVLLY